MAFEPEVGRHRRDQPAAAQQAAPGPVGRDRRHQLIAVDDAADLVAHDQPIGVAIERDAERSEEHTSELQSLMRISYAVFCLKKKTPNSPPYITTHHSTLSYPTILPLHPGQSESRSTHPTTT